MEVHVDVAMANLEAGAAAGVPRCGARQADAKLDANRAAVGLGGDPASDVDVEGEGRELNQRIEGEVAIHAGLADLGVEIEPGSELKRVGGERLIGPAAEV